MPPRKMQPKIPPIEKRPNPVILWQADAVIAHAEAVLSECLENGEELPAAAGQAIAVMVAERQNAVDRIVAWLTQKEDSAAFAKAMAQGWREIAARTEAAKASISTFIQNYIDNPANAERVTNGNQLVGSVLKLWTQKSPDKLVIEEESDIPAEFRYQEFRIRAYGGKGDGIAAELAAYVEAYQSGNDPDPAVTFARVMRPLADGEENPALPIYETVDTTRVRAALIAGKEVAGAKMDAGRHLRHTKISKTHLEEIGGLPDGKAIEASAEEADGEESDE